MGFSYSATSSTVAVTGDLNLTSNSVQALTDVKNNGTVTLGTVGAGKVWRIIGMSLSNSVSGATTNTAYIDIDATVIMKNQSAGNANGASGVQNHWSGSYADSIVATAGQVISLTSGASGYGGATVLYVEEAA